tara:strand:- start:1002 stop:2207 length:1206 start_codon:yes stop_codon:yes gene_type:complete
MNFNKILKTTKPLEEIVGPNILDKIKNENDKILKEKLSFLKLNRNSSAGEVYRALIAKIAKAEQELCGYLGTVDCGSERGMQVLMDESFKICPPQKGMFLKQERAKEMLLKYPPKRLVNVLGYNNISDLLKKEDLFEIYGSLRFIESGEFMGKLLEQYKTLKHEDFEEREIKGVVLSKKRWHDLAETFIKKKYHNLTHLKELGVIFAIPREVSNEVGIVLTTFSLILHYIHEVSFYAKTFQNLDGQNIGEKMIPIILGDIHDPKDNTNSWRIIQRYLAKDKNPDKRAFEPHINPEPVFWAKADKILTKLAKQLPGQSLDFWENLDWTGGYFKDQKNQDVLLTLNSVDIAMSFANQKPLKHRYVYHFKEALWNKIFSDIAGGRDKMEKLMLENMSKGYIEIN